MKTKALKAIVLSISVLTWSCSTVAPPNTQNESKTSQISSDQPELNTTLNAQGGVPGRVPVLPREPVDYFTSCAEILLGSQPNVQGIDDLTIRSLRNSSWIKSTLRELGLSENLDAVIDYGKSSQITTSKPARCGYSTDLNYVNAVNLKIKVGQYGNIDMRVSLSVPINYYYERWMTDKGQKLYLISNGNENNIDNGDRVEAVEVKQQIFSKNELFILGSEVARTISSPDPTVRTTAAFERGFIIDGAENITSQYSSPGLQGMRIAIARLKGAGNLTAQSTLSQLAIIVMPTNPNCKTPNPPTSGQSVGSASLSSLSIEVCPVIYPPFLITSEPNYEYQYAVAVCVNEKYNVDRSERELFAARTGLLASTVVGILSVGAAIAAGPIVWAVYFTAATGVGSAGVFGNIAITYHDKELDKQKAVSAYNNCLQRNRTNKA